MLKRTFAKILVTFIFLSLHIGDCNAQTIKIEKNGNLRSGPSTSEEIIGKVTIGTEVTQIEKSGVWYKVKLPNQNIGWIHNIIITRGESVPDSDTDYIKQNIVKEKIKRIIDLSEKMKERNVQTSATLENREYGEINKKSNSSAVWWAFSMEENGDTVTSLFSLPRPQSGTSWGASIVAKHKSDRIVLEPTGNGAIFACQRFEDVLTVLGVGSDIRFNSSDWVDFYGEKFRNGGFHIYNTEIIFKEGTEMLVNDTIYAFSNNLWIASKKAIK